MNMLMKWLGDAKTINDVEKGVNYSEEAFNQIYDEAVKLVEGHKNDLRFATGKGAIIGAASVGLVGLGVYGVNKLRRNRKNVKKVKGVKKVLEKADNALKESEMLEFEVEETPTREVSKKEKEALAEVITELKEHEKKKISARKK